MAAFPYVGVIMILEHFNRAALECFVLQINIWNIIYLNCRERYEDIVDHHSYIHNLHVSRCKFKAFKNNSVLKSIQTHDLCDTSTVHYQLSYQANWKLITLLVRTNFFFQA